MSKRSRRPTFDTLEDRSLLALIVDIDTGIMGTPPLRTSMFPSADFDTTPPTPGVPTITSGHGTLMAQRFAVAEAFAGRHDTLLDIKTSNASNLFTPNCVAQAMTWIARDLAPIEHRKHPRQQIIVTAPMAGSLPWFAVKPILKAERMLAAAGIVVSAAAGDTADNNDTTYQWPGGSIPLFHDTNVLTVAATDPTGHLQSWSDYGATSVQVAVAAQYGTSEAAILGGIALAATESDVPRRPGESGVRYATQVIAVTLAKATPDGALAGLVLSGDTLTGL